MDTPSDIMVPPLRRDIRLHDAPADESGTPVYMIEDPLHASFQQADWHQVQVLRLMDRRQSVEDLHERVGQTTTCRITLEELAEFCNDVVARGLTTSTNVANVSQLVARRRGTKVSPWRWLLHHAIYFRIPLLHPDGFLKKTVGLARRLVSPVPVALWCLAALAGLYFLLQRPSEYVGTFEHFLTWRGALVYGLAMIVIKAVHEFSHAYTARSMNCRVPRMGLAFIVLWPIPYCDVTDSWKLSDRRRRLLISLAGVLAELAVAGVALCVWGMAEPGLVKSLAFVLSSATLLSTLLANLNPAMRFDGYYIFADLAGIDNLQPRSFALAKHLMRRRLFGLDLGDPEPELSRHRRTIMTTYALYAWVYRFFLYLSIALLVYYRFTKTVGVVLMVSEVLMFIVAPVVREVRLLMSKRRLLKGRIRVTALALVLVGVGLWLALPLRRRESIPATTVPVHQQIVFAPQAGRLTGLSLVAGDTVARGQRVASVEDAGLQHEVEACRARLAGIRCQIERQRASRDDLGTLASLQEEHRRQQARLDGLVKRLEQSHIVAARDGVVAHVDESLYDGASVPAGHMLARIVVPDDVEVRAYLPEDLSGMLEAGDEVTYRRADGGPSIKCVVKTVSPVRQTRLPFAELASITGGPIAVKPDRDAGLVPMQNWYEVRLRPVDPGEGVRLRQAGTLVFKTQPRSLALEGVSYLRRVIRRESNL